MKECVHCLLFVAAFATAQDTVLRVETKVVLVDAVVTDKKGNYVSDLKQKDFKVWEDNKEQAIKSFSFGADPASPLTAQPRFLVLFFDNAAMNLSDQAMARRAAASFIDANAGPNRLMAIVNFGGSVQVAQNFTADTDRLKAVVGGAKIPSNPSPNDLSLGRVSDFGARNAILAIRSLAKNLAGVPGRKSLVLLTAGFGLTQENVSEMTAAIDVCNRSNVAIYPIDVRGVAGGIAPAEEKSPFEDVEDQPRGIGNDPEGINQPMNPGAGNGVRGGSPRWILPKMPPTASKNQQMMYMLAQGTGGSVIVNTNHLLRGMRRVAKELNEFYLIGYTPLAREDGTACHTIRVKVDRSGTEVRARTGYCTAKMQDALAQTPVEKILEAHADAAQAGDIAASMETPYFFIGPNLARVHAAIDVPARSLKFEKEKGKLRSTINILGIAYKADGTVGARFSDSAKIDFDGQKQNYHYEKEFKIASGEYQLKVVWGAGSTSFGKIDRPLVIDSYDVKNFSLSALALSVQFQKAADADDGAALLDDRTPLIADGFRLTPAGSAKFAKTDTVGMYFEIYEPALLNADGAKRLDLGVEVRAFDAKGAPRFYSGMLRVAMPESSGNPSVPVAVTIPTATLEPGTYKVEVTALDGLNNRFQRMATIEVR